MKILNLPLTITFLFLPLLIFSQKNPIKYSKLSNQEKTIEKSDLDPDANAIILCDFGEINFEGINVIITRHVRIKILNKNGLEEANIEIPFFAKGKTERITKIKAQTLNVNDQGKIEKTKVAKSDIYTLDINENWKTKRFAFPNVKPGSIIEYVFSKTSKDAVSLEEWSFQNELPTLKSHLNVLISQGLDYKIVYNGTRIMNKYGNESRNSWVLENLPPLEEESFCPNIEDYKESIRFQLASYTRRSKMQGGGLETVKLMTTWEQLAKDILNHKDYVGVLKQKKNPAKILKKIISEEDSDLEKVKKIYAHVQDRLSWDGKYRLFPDQNFTEIFTSEKGSSCEINLGLVRLLKSAGLDANPLIISTKNHGLVTKVYPLYTQFNHVLAQVKIGDKDILMDAISSFRPYNLLSQSDLNSNGYLLSKIEPRWVKIQLPKKTKTIVVSNLKFLEEEMQYKTSFAFFEHDAVEYREFYHEKKGDKSFVTDHLINSTNEDLVLDSFSVKNAFDLEKPFSVICYFKIPLEEGLETNYIYIDPLIKKHFTKNPFSKPNRYLPVDFISPSSERFILNLHLPDNYVLAEEPISTRLSTQSQKSNYDYLFIKVNSRQIQLSSELIIKNPLILPNEYGDLRELFNQMMGLQSTQLVLKRK